jgi:signal transduction histidine kinase
VSTGRLHIMACELYGQEIKAIEASGAFPELDFSTYANRCGRPPLSVNELQDTLGWGSDYDRVILIGGCCLAALEARTTLLTECRIVRLEYCFSLVAGAFAVNQYLREGGYLVTPGWVRSWRHALQSLGFDGKRELAREFFKETTKKVVLLDTGMGSDSLEAVAAFADHIQRPFTVVPVGLDLLTQRIENAATLWQAESFSQSGEMLQRTCADYSMAFDLLDVIAQSYEEEEIIIRILTLFQTLFAATGVAFVTLTQGVPEKITLQGEFREGSSHELLTAATALTSDYTLPDEMQGRFLFKVANRGQVLGIIIVDGLSLPKYREQYLSLALSTGELSGIILKNARIFQELNVLTKETSTQRDELQKAYSDLRDVKALAFQQEKLTSIGQLAAGVAHEINNPLGFITSNLGTLGKYLNRIMEFVKIQSDCLEESRNPRLLERAAESSQRLRIEHIVSDTRQLIAESTTGARRVHEIIRGLIHFARVDSDDLSLADINDCLTRTIAMIQSTVAPLAPISCCYGALPLLPCSSLQLNQVFMNLLINAAQASDSQGVITVTTCMEDDTICVTISDSGCGIPVEQLPRIFEPFFTTREVGTGTGLGLFLAYDIVKRHRGEILVESRMGAGSTFTVKLPVTADARDTRV